MKNDLMKIAIKAIFTGNNYWESKMEYFLTYYASRSSRFNKFAWDSMSVEWEFKENNIDLLAAAGTEEGYKSFYFEIDKECEVKVFYI